MGSGSGNAWNEEREVIEVVIGVEAVREGEEEVEEALGVALVLEGDHRRLWA